ncbi:MAG: hypothetical protein MZV64_19895 [Ignavibacteriales bacterium]|nr:hypothetical protein [Ignavibacteriales bacterium]
MIARRYDNRCRFAFRAWSARTLSRLTMRFLPWLQRSHIATQPTPLDSFARHPPLEPPYRSDVPYPCDTPHIHPSQAGPRQLPRFQPASPPPVAVGGWGVHALRAGRKQKEDNDQGT